MDLIVRLIVGGIIGWIASIIMKTNAQMGIVANVVVGVVGMAIGAWLASLLGIAGGTVVSWLVSIAGAVILIAVLKKLGMFK